MKKDTWNKYLDDDRISEEDENQFLKNELERLKKEKDTLDKNEKCIDKK